MIAGSRSPTAFSRPIASPIGGFAGGLVAVLLKRPVEDTGPTTGKVVALAGSLIVSVLCAGFAGPFTAAWLNNPAIEDAIELAFFSFLWGAGAQMGLLTTAVAALQRRIDKLGGS